MNVERGWRGEGEQWPEFLWTLLKFIEKKCALLNLYCRKKAKVSAPQVEPAGNRCCAQTF